MPASNVERQASNRKRTPSRNGKARERWELVLAEMATYLRNEAPRDKRISSADFLSAIAEVVTDPNVRADHLRGWTWQAAAEPRVEPTELPPYPEYPLELPGPLGALLEARGRLRPALTGGTGLGALAAVCPRAELHVMENRDWVARPVLWIPIVADTGAGKTPAYKNAFRPIQEYETESGECIVRSDITFEMLARILAENDEHVTLASDELATLLGNIGNYATNSSGRNKDLGRFLQLWSSQPWNYSRVTDKLDIRIANPVVSVVGTIQPSRLHLLGPVDNGMRGRWLLHHAEAPPKGDRVYAKTPREWREAVTALAENLNDSREWRMSRDAGKAWQAAQDRWDNERAGESDQVSSALRKADEQALRVALTLAESCDTRASSSMGVRRIANEIMTAAIAIVDYSLNCWRAAPGEKEFSTSPREEKLNDAAERVREWLERQPNHRATERDLLRAKVGGMTSAADREKILAAYTRRYGIDRVRIGKSTSRGGAKPHYVLAPRRARS